MKQLAGRVAVITGAGSGIGRALARALAHEGTHLALVDLGEAGLEATRAEVARPGLLVTTHVADVRDRARMEALAREVHAAHGVIHLLFNNAGITISKSFEESSLEEIDRVMDINVGGVIHGCHFFLPYLEAAHEAHIVNTASMAGFLGLPNQLAYSASKAAVRSLSETLRAELAHRHIGVTAVFPGAIKTNIMKAAVAHGSDAEETQRLEALVMRFGMDADRLARKVLRAVKRDRARVLVGVDAYLLEWLKRAFPVALHAPLAWAFARAARSRAPALPAPAERD